MPFNILAAKNLELGSTAPTVLRSLMNSEKKLLFIFETNMVIYIRKNKTSFKIIHTLLLLIKIYQLV